MRDETKQNAEACCALRWHVTRVYERLPGGEAPQRSLHLTIHRSVPGVEKQLAQRDALESLRHGGEEEWSWWDRDRTVEGFVPESTLIRALAERNALPLGEVLVEPRHRQLAEDMVLLEILATEDDWERAVTTYDGGREDLPELSDLAEAAGSRWLDITQLARRAAKSRYQRALRESGPAGGAYASKR